MTTKITLLLLFISTALSSQEIGIGTSWTYDSFSYFTPPNSPTTDDYTITGEEIINGKTYFAFDNFGSCGPAASHLRIEDRKYYVLINDEEILLHDFNLLPGESYFFKDIIENTGDSLEIIIDSIGETIIDGITLQTQYCSFAGEIGVVDWNLTFIEYVGSVGFLLPQSGVCTPGAGNLRCLSFSDGTFLKFTLDDKCDQFLGSSYFWKGSQWYFEKWGIPQSSEVVKIVIEKDSINQFGEYKIMEILDDENSLVEGSQILLTSDDNKVFFLDQNGDERLLFDFSYNLEIGDTVSYYLPENANLYDISSNGGIEPIINPYRYVITGIDNEISTTSQTIRRWQVNPINTEINGEIIGNRITEIIEGIGPTGGFMRRGLAQLLSGEQESFRCYFSNAFNYSEIEQGECDGLSDGLTTLVSGVKISPNPTSGLFQIKSKTPFELVSVFDIQGQKIKSFQFGEHLNLYDQTPGVYFIKIDFEEGTINKKVIKL